MIEEVKDGMSIPKVRPHVLLRAAYVCTRMIGMKGEVRSSPSRPDRAPDKRPNFWRQLMLSIAANEPLPMSRPLTRPFSTLHLCEREATLRCAVHPPPHRHSGTNRAVLRPQHHVHLTTRPFSSSPPWHASSMGRITMPSMRKQMQPSIGAARQQQMQQAMREGQIPDDMGLLPETFVMPRGKNRPSWFSNFRGRWRLEKKRLRTRLSELGRYVGKRTNLQSDHETETPDR